MSEITAEQLFRDYLYWRENTESIRLLKERVPVLRPMQATSERLELFSLLIRWCAEQGLPPRQWLYFLFAIRFWKYSLKLTENVLLSSKLIPKFKKFKDYSFFKKYINTNTNYNLFDPNIHINKTVEESKQRLLNQWGPSGCMNLMMDETFGYHPKSTLCQNCGEAMACYLKLQEQVGYDIIALRLGQITPEQARKQVLYGS